MKEESLVGARVKFKAGPWIGRVGEVVREWDGQEFSVRIDVDDPSGPTVRAHRNSFKRLPRKKVTENKSLVEMLWGGSLNEVDCQSPNVELNKVRRDSTVKKKFSVCVKDGDSVKKVTFGDPDMSIRKSDDDARKSFRARHNCDDPGPKTKARYWACKTWEKGFDLP